jgi:hypothetical protein
MPVHRIKLKIRHVDSTGNPIGSKKSILQLGKVSINNHILFTPFYCVSSPVLSATARWLTTAPGQIIKYLQIPRRP